MTFRANFLIECVTSISWALMNIGFYLIVFQHASSIGADTGWGRNEFFIFLATTWLINSLVQAFFMPNAQEFSDLIRTGGLDFALLKPIDTQFLISFRKIDWSALSNFIVAVVLLVYGLSRLAYRTDPEWTFHWTVIFLYPFYIGCGALLMYSLMTAYQPPAFGWDEINAFTTFGSTLPTSHVIPWRSINKDGESRCGESLPL